MKQHVSRSHLKEKNHKCETCDKKFYQKKNLKDHIHSVHMDDALARSECKECGKTFKSLGYLDQHKRFLLFGNRTLNEKCTR